MAEPTSKPEKEHSGAGGAPRVVLDAVVRHPSFDADGYPTEETLATIKAWPYDQLPALAEYIRESWNHHYGRMRTENKLLKLATGGWSGNESVLQALHEQRIFCAMYWESSHRGGLECFRMPNTTSELPRRNRESRSAPLPGSALWTTDKPKVPGRYWTHWRDDDEWSLKSIMVTVERKGNGLMVTPHGPWAPVPMSDIGENELRWHPSQPNARSMPREDAR